MSILIFSPHACRSRLKASTGLLGLALMASPALAQETELAPVVVDQPTASAIGPETESVVAERTTTGSKTDTPIEDLPAAVSVVTEHELDARGVSNMQQAVAYTAGVATDEFGSDDRYDYFRIRGFGATVLGTYRDGLSARIPAWYTASRLEPYGLQRVEVMKGSTSSLFGLNAPGGLINAITKRPPETTQGEAYVTIGEYEHKEVGVDFGGPIDKDGHWLYRLTGKWQDAESEYDYSQDDRIYIAPALTYKPNDSFYFTFLGDYLKRDGIGARSIPTGSGIDPTTFLGEPDFDKFDTEQTDLGYQTGYTFDNGLQLRQSFRYTNINLDYEEVYGATTDPTAMRVSFGTQGSGNRFVVDNQAQYDATFGSADTKTLVGFDYAHDDVDEDIIYGVDENYVGLIPGIDIYNPSYCGRSCVATPTLIDWNFKQQALGIYAQEQVTLWDKLIFTVGGRYDYVNTDTYYKNYGYGDDVTAEDFTSRFGVTYKILPGLAAYANYSESFQPIVAPSANYGVISSTKPQEGTQYEVGLKYKPADYNALFTLAYFDLTQTNVPAVSPAGVYAQIRDINVKGIELEGKFNIIDRLNLTLAYSYWQAEIEKDGAASNTGNRPSQTPDHMASAWLDYTIPGDGGLRGDFTFGAGVRYVGASYGDDANTTRVDAYTLVDAMAKYNITEDVSLQLNATNLLDKEYVATSYYGSDYYGDRRKVMATLKYTW